MTQLLLALLLIFAALAVLLVVLLVLFRLLLSLRAEKRASLRADLRALLLTATLGDEDEARTARERLQARRGPAWDRVEDQILRMLPKVKGDVRASLVALLAGRGAREQARRRTRSRSLVRRSRGAHQLGALADPGSVEDLLRLLQDRRFVVRRVSVRALGQVGDPSAVPALLDAVEADPTLTRDVLAALRTMGTRAVVPLRDDLARALAEPTDHAPPSRRAALVATSLGLLGDLPSTGLLVRSLPDVRHPGLAAAAAGALGEIGTPDAVPALVSALDTDPPDLAVAAARALGQISDPAAVGGLAGALAAFTRAAGHESSRAAAAALLRLGPDGLAALDGHGSPYAAEALAVHRLRSGAR